jgi:DNA modification methylase
MSTMATNIEKVTIGPHALYCGDCRDVLPALGKVDAVVTDPPYGILNGSAGRGAGKLKSRALNAGNTKWDTLPDKLTIDRVIGSGKDAIIWGGNYFELPPCRGFLIWDKMQPWPNFSAAEMAWTSINRPSAIFRMSACRGEKGVGNTHPTVKPLQLMEWCLGFIPNASTIIDPFMGSGTTGVACANLNRNFIGIELDPGYFEIAVKRMTEAVNQCVLFTGRIEPKRESLLF